MENFTYKAGLEMMGVNYLGAIANSAKIKKSLTKGVMTYCVYLAPWKMAGVVNGKQINVCPNSDNCRDFCLNKSGRNKADILAHGEENSKVNQARIKKTRFFFEDRETFMQVLVSEIKRTKKYAESNGFGFSVRLNGTSDISPLAFRYMNKNILDIFPEVMFYDYSKRPHAIEESMAHKNYDITFSYDGSNLSYCLEFLRKGGNVAMVFFGDELPKTFDGWEVIDGNLSDVRYMDKKGVIVGLHYHPTANDFYRDETSKRRKFHRPNTNFVVFPDDERWNK